MKKNPSSELSGEGQGNTVLSPYHAEPWPSQWCSLYLVSPRAQGPSAKLWPDDRAATHRDACILLALVGGGHHGQVLDDFLGVFCFPSSRFTSERQESSDPPEQ